LVCVVCVSSGNQALSNRRIVNFMEHEKELHKKGGLLNYNYIIDGIYVGTNQCCEGGLSEVLKKEGITIDISLEEYRLDQPFGVDSYLWIPIKDNTAPTQGQFDIAVTALQEFVRQKKKVYLHCKNGHGRSTTILSAYLIKQGNTPEEALKTIKDKRPGVHLSKEQEVALKEYASRV